MGDREGWVVFKCNFQVIRGGDDLFDEGCNELESDISCDEEWTYPFDLRM